MKHTIAFLVLVLFLALSGCEKEEEDAKSLPFQAKVIGQGIDCGDTYLIEILNDSIDIFNETGSYDRTYYADQLATALKQNGLQIQLDMRNPAGQEMSACTTFGPGYAHIVVLDAEIVD